eukprot:1865386-Pyramimonas_sp.AAC.1
MLFLNAPPPPPHYILSVPLSLSLLAPGLVERDNPPLSGLLAPDGVDQAREPGHSRGGRPREPPAAG